jgi:hypothetical protein
MNRSFELIQFVDLFASAWRAEECIFGSLFNLWISAETQT